MNNVPNTNYMNSALPSEISISDMMPTGQQFVLIQYEEHFVDKLGQIDTNEHTSA